MEVPSTILNDDDEQEAYFNASENIMLEVMRYESSLRDKVSLSHLVDNYDIPGHVLLRLVSKEERACSAPNDHWMPIYLQYLRVGLHFLVPELLIGLLMDYRIGLTQLVPNAIWIVIAFLVYCRVRGVTHPITSIFKYFYVIKV